MNRKRKGVFILLSIANTALFLINCIVCGKLNVWQLFFPLFAVALIRGNKNHEVIGSIVAALGIANSFLAVFDAYNGKWGASFAGFSTAFVTVKAVQMLKMEMTVKQIIQYTFGDFK